MRLLIVEDDAPLASGLSRILEAEGHAVDVTARGEDAVLAASQERFDLVILDIGLPRMDGFEVLRRLRAAPRTKALPVIMVTSFSRDRDAKRGRELGANDYIVKPLMELDFLKRVEHILKD
jgi:DNA-binding response OmpR family regulator